jgi:uncharacterized membrane protein YozB (DUF420 family)
MCIVHIELPVRKIFILRKTIEFLFFFVYLEDHSARYYDPTYNSSSSLTHTYFLLLFVVTFLTTIQWS